MPCYCHRVPSQIILHASSSSQCRISRAVNSRYTQRLVNISPRYAYTTMCTNDINARSLYRYGSRFYFYLTESSINFVCLIRFDIDTISCFVRLYYYHLRAYLFSFSAIMVPKGCAPTTSTTKCHYYEKPSTVPVASPLPL